MNSRTIIHAMGDVWTSKQLEIALRPYIPITYEEVCNFVLDGIDDWRAKFVAFVLGLKKYIPEGWKPTFRKIKHKSSKSRVEAITHAQTTNRPWASYEKETLRVMARAGFTNKEISHALKRTEGAVTMAICKWSAR